MIGRLRIKFVCINMSIVAAILFAAFGLILYSTASDTQEQCVEMMRTIAMRPNRPELPDRKGPGIPLTHFIFELNEEGSWIVTDDGNYDLTDPALVEELAMYAEGETSGIIREYNLRFLQTTVHGIRRIVFADISRDMDMIQDLALNCLMIGAAAFCVFLVISILLAHWAVKPVAAAWEQQRQFVADASHELKTPLTVILSNAQMLAESGEDAALQRKLTSNILTVSHQMRDLVEKLLRSAKADQGQDGMVLTATDLSEAVNAAMLSFDAIYYEQGKTLYGDIADGVKVPGSRQHLIQVVDILLDNALKYSAEKGSTHLTLHRQGTRYCLLTVSSEGKPLSSTELKDIFKRFYRADPARERTGSYGLGLSIAESIIKAHNGKIWAETGENCNIFRIKLPMSSI